MLTGFTITGGKGTVTVLYPGYFEKSGGGVFMASSGAKIERNRIIDNHITAGGDTSASAAGILVAGDFGGHIVIRDNDISQNTATVTGANGYTTAAVGLWTKGPCLFEKNRVAHNVGTATSYGTFGGGLYIDGEQDRQGPYIIRNNVISDNILNAASGWGGAGGVFILNCSPILTNNIISGNVSSGWAGGIYVLHWAPATGIPKPVFINNTITNNTAATRGGGIRVDATAGSQLAGAIVMNTIVWGNSAATGSEILVDEGSITVRYSNVQGGWSGEGNIDADPQLVADSLSNDSPCIGAGIDVYDFGGGVVLSCPPYDINGNSRPFPAGSKPDMGAMESKLGSPVTGVDSDPQTDIPKTYALGQSYPNPFNPSTTIEFALPKASLVTLKIYDLLGNEVVTLVAEKLPAGRHERVWEAKDLASGVYLYRLEAGEFVQTRKLILLR